MNTLEKAGARYASAMSHVGVVLVAASILNIMFGDPVISVGDWRVTAEGWRVMWAALFGFAGIAVGAHWGD